MNANDKQHRAILQRIAQRGMLERGLVPDFSVEALAELTIIQAPATKVDALNLFLNRVHAIPGGVFFSCQPI